MPMRPTTVMNRHSHNATSIRIVCLIALLVAVGCARAPGAGRGLGIDGATRAPHVAAAAGAEADAPEDADYDPWQPFNEKMFAFNHGVLDRFLIKPMATGWEKVAPDVVRRSIARAFDNLEMPRRLVNNLLQARPLGAGRELARFTINTTAGVAGFIDVARWLKIEPSNADAGQTLALLGVGAGPYLVLPTLPPLTVRDAIGRGIDGLLDPIGYLLPVPFFANQAKSVVTAVNDRSLHLKLFAGVEDSVLDLYSSARNGYLQRRRIVVARAAADRNDQWQWAFRPAEPTDRVIATLSPLPEDPA
jgi:phospholipid-binding lipoprotein MlaA